MPELPEVELFRKQLEDCCLNRRVRRAEVKNEKILQGKIKEDEIESYLQGRKFLSIKRRGKWLFLRTDDGNWLVMHFGMTGSPECFKDMKDEPKYDRFLISFEDGQFLCLDDPRLLGRVGFTKSASEFIKRKGLGVDALEMSLEDFKDALEGRTGKIKSVLMNQAVIAGVGNIYSDEILFQAGVHPLTPVDRLTNEELEDLFNETKQVLEKSVEVQTDFKKLPPNFLLRHRKRGGRCPGSEGHLETVKVGGRTAYYCPKRQKLRL